MTFAIILAAAGIAWALRAGKAKWLTDVLALFTFFQKMFECAFCVGFHCGYGAYFLSGQWASIPSWQVIGVAVVYAFAGATASLLLDIVERNLD